MPVPLSSEQRRDAMRLASGIVLDQPRPEQAVAFARSLVASGSVSPAVLELAGMPNAPRTATMADVGPLIEAIFDELGLALPSRFDAAWITARRLAEDILAGAVDPVAGAHAMWWLWEDCGSSPEVADMLQILDVWDGGHAGWTRERAEAEIMANARRVIDAADRYTQA